MTRHSNAARDLAALLANASPDIAQANAHQVQALAADAAAEMAALAPPARGRAAQAKASAPTEHDEQCTLFAWAEAAVIAMPETMLLFAIPNGGARHPAVAAQLKREGVRAGIPDVFLPAMRRGQDGRIYGGLFVEVKRRDHSNHATTEQREWMAALREAGYMCVLAYGADEAITAITTYLSQK